MFRNQAADPGLALNWFDAGVLTDRARVTTRLLRAYVAWLADQGYAKATIARRLAAVRSWFRFLCRQGILSANPADGLRGPRQDRKLPHFMSEADLERLLQTPQEAT